MAEPSRLHPEPHLEREREYLRVLTLGVLDRALCRLEQDQAERGHATRFATLLPWMTASPTSEDLAKLGNALGLGPTSVKIAVHALRQRFGSFVRSEIENLLGTRDDAEAVQAEMDVLLGALAIFRR
jgi:hypothetical protein